MREEQQPEPWPDRARSPRRNGVVHAVMIHRRGSETACGLDAETYRVLSPDNADSLERYVECYRCRRVVTQDRVLRSHALAIKRQEEKGT